MPRTPDEETDLERQRIADDIAREEYDAILAERYEEPYWD